MRAECRASVIALQVCSAYYFEFGLRGRDVKPGPLSKSIKAIVKSTLHPDINSVWDESPLSERDDGLQVFR